VEINKLELVRLVGEIEDRVSAYIQNMKLNDRSRGYRPVQDDKEPTKTIETLERQ